MLIPKEKIEGFCAVLREAGQRIVFTNGCFDILHAGHVRYLEEARALGDCLVLGLNTDASVRRLKGETRPVNTELDRAAVTGALAAVDYVVLFDEPTAETLIEKVRPAVYVKGGDYTRETLARCISSTSFPAARRRKSSRRLAESKDVDAAGRREAA